MLKVATKANGETFRKDERATSNTIDHGMTDLDFMVFCDTNPLAILCECGCASVSGHNSKVNKLIAA